MANHPYRGLPDDQFWKTGVAAIAAEALDPMRAPRFTFSPDDSVAAAGSCFAQHIARHLQRQGYNYLQTEPRLAPDEPVFSARFGNIYTVRQLHQLLLAAYGLHRPATRAWQRPDGRFIDPLRPQLFPDGFAGAEDVSQARQIHLAAVRRVFQECRVFVFTLGLTEAWLAPDGTALPVPPGVLGVEPEEGEASFHNFTVAEMRQDMDQFLVDLLAVNHGVRVILTVSPVPLVATYLPRHVLVSNTYSKAALRVVAEAAVTSHRQVEYFPSYEIITAPQARGSYFEPDLRSVSPDGVAHVMRVFTAHMMRADAAPIEDTAEPVAEPSEEARARYAALSDVLCDEELLDIGSQG
jgi:hypothetical protein